MILFFLYILSIVATYSLLVAFFNMKDNYDKVLYVLLALLGPLTLLFLIPSIISMYREDRRNGR